MFDNTDNYFHVCHRQVNSMFKDFYDKLDKPLNLKHPVRFSILLTLASLSTGALIMATAILLFM